MNNPRLSIRLFLSFCLIVRLSFRLSTVSIQISWCIQNGF